MDRKIGLGNRVAVDVPGAKRVYGRVVGYAQTFNNANEPRVQTVVQMDTCEYVGDFGFTTNTILCDDSVLTVCMQRV